MEHHAPHPRAAFEGYYNKFRLPSGAHLVIVISKINNPSVKTKPNTLSFVYMPRDAAKVWRKDFFPSEMIVSRISSTGQAFILEVPDIGFAKWDENGNTQYKFRDEALNFEATTASGLPWSDQTDTPEGLLVHLPLPLHWHVQSLGSECTFSLDIPEYELPKEDRLGQATVHQEKNWAHAFPTAHMWIQARDGERGLCLAGGEILGMEAFLLGYRSEDLELDFRPPFATRLLGIGPFMSFSSNWETRSFELSLQSFRQKIMVKATAPKGSFFPLHPPFAEGHRENYLAQSFQTNVEVKIYESGWLDSWRLVKEDAFGNASLEFGGAYYPPAGSQQWAN